MTPRPTAVAPSAPVPGARTPLAVPELDPSSSAPATAPFEPHTPRRPAAPTPAPPARTAGDLARTAGLLAGILLASLLIGRIVGARGGSLLHDRMLPWILGRGLGVAAYLALTGTVVLGLWLRHPWRARFRRPSAAGILWAHVALAAGTVALVAGHVAALALDGLLLVVATAGLAGSSGRAVWCPVHSAAVLVFCVSLAHGATAGSDGSSLRWVYAASGLVVVVLQSTRWVVGALTRGPGLPDR